MLPGRGRMCWSFAYGTTTFAAAIHWGWLVPAAGYYLGRFIVVELHVI